MIQQIAHLAARDYFFWSVFTIPERKDVHDVDAKILQRYPLRNRQRLGVQQPLSKCRYLRFERWGILLATHGASPFFAQELYRDCRQTPIELFGYSVRYRLRKGKLVLCVELNATLLEDLTEHLEAISPQMHASLLRAYPVMPFGGVKRQLFGLLDRLNQLRSAQGLEPLGYDTLPPLKRRQLRVFVP